jgi:flagellar basal body-associated protein FliL
MNNTPKSSKKTAIIIIVIIIVALIAYFYYEGNTPVSNSSLETTVATNEAQAVGVRVLTLLNQIKSLKVDTDLFKDASYLTLQDYSVQIPPENVGRSDPFAPLVGMQRTGSTTGSLGARR